MLDSGRVAGCQLARGVLLGDEQGVLLAVLPQDHMIDFQALEAVTGRRFDLVPADARKACFPDCNEGSTPPLGAAYQVTTLVDEVLFENEIIYVEAGACTTLLGLQRDCFRAVMQDGRMARFSRPLDDLEGVLERPSAGFELRHLTPMAEARRQVEALYDLPPMDDTARRILRLRHDPDVQVEEVSALVARDPGLAAQVIRYAQSPLFGYRGRINSVQDAISRVLGVEMVVNMLLGLAVGRSLNNPVDGPLGMHAYWRQAVSTAALCQGLARHAAAGRRLAPGMAYLAGLLHDIGILLLGHMFPADFYLLNRLAAAHPGKPLRDIENEVFTASRQGGLLAAGHTALGGWLMQAWNMPDELVIAAREHHDPGGKGEHAPYARLVCLAQGLLRAGSVTAALGDAACRGLAAGLGLEEDRMGAILNDFLAHQDDLEALIAPGRS